MVTTFVLGSLIGLQAPPFTAPFPVRQPLRLALTPQVDGRIEHEEWQALGNLEGGEAFFQWEPGAIHIAATLPTDRALVVSLDLDGDGWLNGADNLEVVFRSEDGEVRPSVRRLDNTPREAPVWREEPILLRTMTFAAREGETTWTVEASLLDLGLGILPRDPVTIGVRMDAYEFDPRPLAPYLPRSTTAVNLAFEQAIGMPEELRWNPDYRFRRVPLGEELPIRLSFDGNNELGLERIEMRCEGLAERTTLMTALPFPPFDRRGRTFVDYRTRIADNSTKGWRIMRATVTGRGEPIVLRTSFQVAPVAFTEVTLVRDSRDRQGDRFLRLSVYIGSNTGNRLNGVLRSEFPSGWRVSSGEDSNFIIYNARGFVRRVIEVEIPDDTAGVFPVRLTITLGARELTQTHYVRVSPSVD